MVSAVATKTSVGTQAVEPVTSESRVDRDSHFNGLYKTRQNLCIEGVAEGEIECDGTLTVVEGAQVKAKVTASTVTIAGQLQGEVVCRDVFQILPTGEVQATVSARRLIVQEGGLYNGVFHMITEGALSSGYASEPFAASSPIPERTEEEKPDDESTGREDWWTKLLGEDRPAKDGEAESA